MSEMIEKPPPSPVRFKQGFFLGAASLWCANKAFQDWLGRDEYVRRVREGWIDTSWWAWAILAAVFMLYALERRR